MRGRKRRRSWAAWRRGLVGGWEVLCRWAQLGAVCAEAGRQARLRRSASLACALREWRWLAMLREWRWRVASVARGSVDHESPEPLPRVAPTSPQRHRRFAAAHHMLGRDERAGQKRVSSTAQRRTCSATGATAAEVDTSSAALSVPTSSSPSSTGSRSVMNMDMTVVVVVDSD